MIKNNNSMKVAALLCLCIVVETTAFQSTLGHGLAPFMSRGKAMKTMVNVLDRGTRDSLSMSSIPETPETKLPAPKDFLLKVMSSRTGEKEKSVLVEDLRKQRQHSPSDYESYLDKLTAEVESVEGNKWAAIRWPVPLPSYRLKLGCFNRFEFSVPWEQAVTTSASSRM